MSTKPMENRQFAAEVVARTEAVDLQVRINSLGMALEMAKLRRGLFRGRVARLLSDAMDIYGFLTKPKL